MAATGLLLAGTRTLFPAVRPPNAGHFAAIATFDPARTPEIPLVPREEPEPARALPVLPKTHAAPRLLDDDDGALDDFYAALWRTGKREKDAVTRIVHYGDSPTTADQITGDTRLLLQQAYGDAGHGFILIAKPWAWYQHHGVEVSGSGWQPLPASRFQAHDGLFGLGGVSFTGAAGAHSRIVFEGRTESTVRLWYLRQPGGGIVTLSANGAPLGRVDTEAREKEAAFASFPVAAGFGEIELKVERGGVRLFGLSAEKPGPGVVYNSLGLNGASITVLTRMFQQQHWAGQLREADPALVVINYGTNEADFADFIEKSFEKELREAIRRLRAALPDTSILLMSPMDRGRRTGPGEIDTMPTIPRVIEIERRVARETGCGFFDTFDAMGGAGTMARWYAAQPRLVSADLIHPYPAGGRKIAEIYVRELEAGLNRYKLRNTAVR